MTGSQSARWVLRATLGKSSDCGEPECFRPARTLREAPERGSLLSQEPNAALLLGPRIGQRLGDMRNAIHNLDTKWFRNDAGEFPAIVVGLDILDEETAGSFLDHVIEQLKSQRMCSPPTTAHMTVTVAGNMSAERFRDLWAQRSASDP